MIVGVFTILFTKEGHFRQPLHYYYGSFLWNIWNFPSIRFLHNPVISSVEISLSFLSTPSFPQLELEEFFYFVPCDFSLYDFDAVIMESKQS